MDTSGETRAFQIGDCVLDLDRGTLERCGTTIVIRAKTFRLLTYLAQNRGKVLSKDELLDAVWPNVSVTEDSLTQGIRDVRKAIGDEAQDLLRTVARRGYMLVASGSATTIASDTLAPSKPASRNHAPEPVVAVLPFKNLGENPDDGLFVDGIVEEITNGLARFKTVTVIARNSAFAYRNETNAPGEAINRDFGVDFVVEGSVRRIGSRLTIAAALSEAANGHRLWGESFVCEDRELFELNEAIAFRIISRLVANIEGTVLCRPAAFGPENIDAFEHLTRGIALLRSYGDGVNEQAREHFLSALELDDRYGLAHAYLALADLLINGYGSAPRELVSACRNRMLTAIALAPEEARCHRVMALVLLCYREHEAAEQHIRRSLDLNPYDADTLAQMGYLLTMRGRAADGLECLERAVRLNPIHPPWYHFDRSMMLYALREYRKAAEELACIPHRSQFYEARLAASYAMAGMDEKAAEHMGVILANDSDWPVLEMMAGRMEFETEEDAEHVLEGLRRAMDCLRNQQSKNT